ncbi:phosphotransferase, partial [bacterium]|nr:phosphotransferase [bacterium]
MIHLDFEIGARAELTDSLVGSAARFFGLGGVTEYKELGGAFNLNVLVHASSGVFVIRVYRPWVTEERLNFLHVMKEALIKTGLPIPKPIAWAKGSQLGVHTGRLIEVEQYVKNDGVADTWRRHEVAFSMLGRLHNALAKTVTFSQFVPPKVHNYALPKEMLKWIEQTQLLIRQSGLGASAEAMRALQLCDEAKELLAILQGWWVDTGYRLPKQLVHGDYNGGTNVVFNNEHIVAVLDFDLVDIHERIFDIAYSLYFAMGSLEYDKPLPNRPWHRVTQIMEAYNQNIEHPLTAM